MAELLQKGKLDALQAHGRTEPAVAKDAAKMVVQAVFFIFPPLHCAHISYCINSI